MFGLVPAVQRLCLRKLPLPLSLRKFLVHPAGLFTIFFWAPTLKWAISFANIGDMKTPAQNISANQQAAILGTGLIWMRWSVVMTPVNYNLMLANAFMSCTAAYQLYRKAQVPLE